ncbi:MAG: AAA family ATPase [Prevotellaceae bacterium]|jgi:tRNA uridine 5-carbamoylmethylation protein Kti12|nr:AAA family ATPase [Prevotellaceae bacterium]
MITEGSDISLELAHKLLQFTDTDIFLTGKAGTGKTTFLHHLRENSPKRMVVVAPTGVAAINAKGVTIHSFFQLKLTPFVPGTKPGNEFFRYSKEKLNIIRSLDLLVIDEISMVRADLLDAVDHVLRTLRRNVLPFGGVQLLMIGDLEQLAPVTKEEEWSLLSTHYESPFFFDSQALKKTSYVCIELKTVYRQSDEHFINMLNRIRENKVNHALLQELNQRYQPDFHPQNEEGYIVLTTHNSQAQRINNNQLSKIVDKSYHFTATIKGDFPDYSFPTDQFLELKKGAQVMFVKNDLSSEKRYYNGKIAIITHIDETRIEAQGKEDDHPIVVEKAVWSNMKYSINPNTQELVEEEEGSFEQFPLKTAWAITVHKSQGLTFEKAIIDAGSSFAHGQVYVALSRCRTLEGLILRSPITPHSIIRSGSIDSFNRYISDHVPKEQQYHALRKDYFVKMVLEQFTFDGFTPRFRTMLWLLNEHFKNLYPELISRYRRDEESFRNEIINVSDSFLLQLQRLLLQTNHPEEEPFLQERIKKGALYFLEKSQQILQALLNSSAIETDNKEVRKRVNEVLSHFKTEVRQKIKTLEACLDGFSVPIYLNAKSKATVEVEEKKEKKKKSEKQSEPMEKEEGKKGRRNPAVQDSVQKVAVSEDILHPELYEKLRSWRFALAKKQSVPAYVILSQRALIGITNLLPQDLEQLLQISGIGKVTASRYGQDILNMVKECVHLHGYAATPFRNKA